MLTTYTQARMHANMHTDTHTYKQWDHKTKAQGLSPGLHVKRFLLLQKCILIFTFCYEPQVQRVITTHGDQSLLKTNRSPIKSKLTSIHSKIILRKIKILLQIDKENQASWKRDSIGTTWCGTKTMCRTAWPRLCCPWRQTPGWPYLQRKSS